MGVSLPRPSLTETAAAAAPMLSRTSPNYHGILELPGWTHMKMNYPIIRFSRKLYRRNVEPVPASTYSRIRWLEPNHRTLQLPLHVYKRARMRDGAFPRCSGARVFCNAKCEFKTWDVGRNANELFSSLYALLSSFERKIHVPPPSCSSTIDRGWPRGGQLRTERFLKSHMRIGRTPPYVRSLVMYMWTGRRPV